jgi:tetratricopeptide (TPR) repeat protein
LIAGRLLRHLSDRGALRRTAAGLDAEESSLREAHELPETLAALLGGRLDSATDVAPDPALARALLEAASLLSPEPSVGDVLALLDAGSATVDRHAADDALDVLIAGSVLTEVRGSEDRIGWATPLLRDAQRARLVGTRRGRRLAQAAASLRASEAPRPARARDLIDVLDLAGQPDAALPFVVDAAEASLAAGDLAESARLFARALPTATGPLRSRCLQGAGETDHLLGRATAAEAAFRTLLTEATSDLDRARAAFRLGRALLLAGRPAEARGPLRDAVGTLSAVSGAEAALELSRAFRALLAAEPDGASIPPLDAERLLGEARGPADRCVHGTTLGYAALRSGDPAAAADRFRAALREADGAGYAPAVVAVLHDLGLALRLARKHDQAIRHLQDAIDLAERARQHPSAARAHNELGELHRERGDLGAAATHYERAASIWDELSSPQAPLARMNLAIVAADRGHLDHAERQLTKALSSLSKDLRGPAAVTRAYVAALSGRAEDATSAIREAASLLGGPSPEASNLLSRAAFALADRGEEAASAAARALAERLLAPASRT